MRVAQGRRVSKIAAKILHILTHPRKNKKLKIGEIVEWRTELTLWPNLLIVYWATFKLRTKSERTIRGRVIDNLAIFNGPTSKRYSSEERGGPNYMYIKFGGTELRHLCTISDIHWYTEMLLGFDMRAAQRRPLWPPVKIRGGWAKLLSGSLAGSSSPYAW